MANPKRRHQFQAIKGFTFRPLPGGDFYCNQTKAVVPKDEKDAYRSRLFAGMRTNDPVCECVPCGHRTRRSIKPVPPKVVLVKTDSDEEGALRHLFICRHCGRKNTLKPEAAAKIQRSTVKAANCKFCQTRNPLSFRSRRAARTDTPNNAPLSKRPRIIANVCKYGDNGTSEFGFTCCLCGQENRMDPAIVEKLDIKRPKRKCLKCQRVNKLDFGQRRRKRRAYGKT